MLNEEKPGDARKIIILKVKTFFEEKFHVHIMQKSKIWKNGYITLVKENYFLLEEDREGEMMFFFDDIYSIEKWMPREVEE